MVVSSRRHCWIARRKGLRRECRRVGRGCQRGLYAIVWQGGRAAAMGEGKKKAAWSCRPGRLSGEGRGATPSHAALNAEFLLQVFYPCQCIVKFMTVDN